MILRLINVTTTIQLKNNPWPFFLFSRESRAGAITRKVGSSFWKRLSAFEKLAEASRVLGITARLITGSGTFIDVIEYLQGTHTLLVSTVRS